MNGWLKPDEPQSFRILRLHAPENEKILLDFQPLRKSAVPEWNPMPEDWSCYREPLRVYQQDYALLLPYFARIYPTADAFDGTPEPAFDPCFSNWIGRKDWEIILQAIDAEMPLHSAQEQTFFRSFSDWLRAALQDTDIIVVTGNL